MFTADGLLVRDDIDQREQLAALCRELLGEALERDFGIKIDIAELTAELVKQFSHHQELASTTNAPNETCHRGIC